eukprot:4491895-Heterocapsa_arctica.AAC.1
MPKQWLLRGPPSSYWWASMPCVGGSPWQNLNRLRTGGQAKVDAHIALFNKIWANFELVAVECITHGGRIAIEWPTGCAYWNYTKVKEFLQVFQLQPAKCNGCAMGLVNDHGAPIKKPWTISTNAGLFWRAMTGSK